MPKKVLTFLGENEKSEKIEKLLSEKLIIGEPEEAPKQEKSPEERQYLLLYVASAEDGEEDIKSFEFIKGRTRVYDFIKGVIDSIDIHESKVLVEGVTLEGMISVYEFMKHISILLEDNFDIEDYNYGDIDDVEDI
jgi:hypothetical protein